MSNFVTLTKDNFKKTIDKFESYSYSYGCNWNANIKKLNLPEFQVAEIV